MKKSTYMKNIIRKCPSCGGDAETIGFFRKGKGLCSTAGWNCPHCGFKKEADLGKLQKVIDIANNNLSLL
jgi:transposase-like protein